MTHRGWLGFMLVIAMLLVALAAGGCSLESAGIAEPDASDDAGLVDGAAKDGPSTDGSGDADGSTSDVATDAPATDAPNDSAPTSFDVTAAAATSTTRITVTFGAPPNPAQAVVLANYAVPGLTLSGTPSLSGNTVSLTTSAQSTIAYTVTATGVTRASDAQALTNASATFTGRAPFDVASASSTSAITLTVTFDAAPNANQATTLASYTVPGLTLSGTPVLAGNVVTLTTSTQSAQSYAVTVATVTRASDGEPLTVATASFNGTSSFNVASAAATDNTTVGVTFDAPPNAVQAANAANYAIPGLTVSAATLAGSVVSLTTSAQSAQSYTVTVSGVTRASDAAALATKTATFSGRTTFNVVSAVSTSASAITVTFDAPPNGTQAIDVNDYTIPGLTLSAPVLSGITVKFTTTAQTATSYTLTVTGVTRAGDGQALTTSTASFTGRTPFDVQGATSNSVTIAITFDAPPNVGQATTLANYSVTGLTLSGVPVLVGSTVTIKTSAQTGSSYTAVVANVGRASDGEGLTVNSATFTGFPRAVLQISEVAVSNAASDGYDFVELLALSGGRVDGLAVREATGPLYTFGSLAVAAGDRIVIHARGACLPATDGCQDEDAAGSTIAGSTEPFNTATAWDVYSSAGGISAADNAVTLRDGATIVDAVALSNRDGDASGASMTAFVELQTATPAAWIFGAAPVDGITDCATQKDTASVATAVTACGGQPTAAGGISLQRSGTDTDQRKDFYAAAQTRGVANAANPPPTVVSVSSSTATGVRIVFDEDLDPGVVVASFTEATLGLTSATLSDVNEVTLVTTGSQTPGQAYSLGIAPGVADLQGTLGGAGTYGFCGFSSSPVGLVINEVAPSIPGSRDLVELRVTSGGAVGGITLRSNPTGGATGGGTLLATLPNLCAATGDLFVVHLTPDATTGESETVSKSEFPNALPAPPPYYAGNFDGAWDVKGGSTGVVATETVLSLYTDDPPGAASATLLDAVAFTSQKAAGCAPLACSTSAGFKSALDLLEAAAEWTPACGGALGCDDATSPSAVEVSASYAGVGNSASTSTVARSAVDTNAAADWTVGPSTLGAAN